MKAATPSQRTSYRGPSSTWTTGHRRSEDGSHRATVSLTCTVRNPARLYSLLRRESPSSQRRKSCGFPASAPRNRAISSGVNRVAPGNRRLPTVPGSPSATVTRTFPRRFPRCRSPKRRPSPGRIPSASGMPVTASSASERSFSSTGAPRFSRDAEMICAGVNRFAPATSISATRGNGRRKKRRSTFPSVSRVNAETSRKIDFSYRPPDRRADPLPGEPIPGAHLDEPRELLVGDQERGRHLERDRGDDGTGGCRRGRLRPPRTTREGRGGAPPPGGAEGTYSFPRRKSFHCRYR